MADPTALDEEARDERAKDGMPPYTAFTSFKSSLQVLKEHVIPNRIDRSVWSNKFSGSVATQILTGYRFLNLIDKDGVPQPSLQKLVKALDTDQWAGVLSAILSAAYRPVFSLDLQKATPSEFAEKFRTAYGADGDTGRKCMTFFLHAAKEAQVQVSSYLMSGAKPRSTNGAARRKPRTKRSGNDHVPPREDNLEDDPSSSMTDKLLAKFPAFDPSWPDELKAKWFKGFEDLMARAKS